MNLEPCTIIWAKTDRKHWPAITLPEDIVCKTARKKHVWVFWFGDYRMSEIKVSCVLPFTELFKKKSRSFFKSGGHKWSAGLYEALQAYGGQLTTNWNNETLLHWALYGFNGFVSDNKEKCLPEFVLQKLHKLLNVKKNSPLKSVKNNASILISNRDTTCLGCYSSEVVDIHPLFNGCICKFCREKIVTTMFLIGDDSINYCCMICGNFGEILICSDLICGRSYCYKCIDNLLSIEKRESLLEDKNWICFMCTSNQDENCLIQRRENWKEVVYNIYNMKLHPILEIKLHKKPIRVLSLFDGISSGLAALKKIKISIDVYYASEIDTTAMSVPQQAYPNEIRYLGDVTKITKDNLKEIIPIDLLIGGSPCNDLSIANPCRKGLFDIDGTGILFFDYFRILMTLKCINNSPFFWLFENVASMCSESKDVISRSLECEATKINSAWMSPQNRERYFWGNLPSLKMNFMNNGPKLQEYLDEGRTAAVEKIGTVTTQPHSMLQGESKMHPVLTKDNEPDLLTITELEKIFGFDVDYTNVPKAGKMQRQELIGRAWSVQTVTMLLHFIKYYFKVNTD